MVFRLSFLIFFITSLLSCSKSEHKVDPNLKVLNQISGPITHLDPQVSTGLAASLQLAKVYDALYEVQPFSEPTDLRGNLADGFPKISKDRLTYTIKIKKDVKYHSCDCLEVNRTVKAQDFVHTFKRISDPKLLSPHYSYYAKRIVGLDSWYEANKEKDKTDYSLPMSGVKALDDYTLEIKLKDPSRVFLNLLTGANTAPIPEEATKFYKNDLSSHTVGTGPYLLKKYIKNSKLIFEKNPNFRDKFFPDRALVKYQSYIKEYKGVKVPIIDRINVSIIKESQTAWLNFMKGKTDYLEVAKDNYSEVFTPSYGVSKSMKDKGIEVGEGNFNTNLYYFGFNQSHPLLKIRKFRQAMALAFDYKKFNELFFNNTAVVATSMLPPRILGNDPVHDGGYTKANLEKAKLIIRKIGKEKLRPLTISVKNSTISRQTAEFFKAQMAKIGIEVNVKSQSWQSLMSDANKGKFDIFYLAWFTGLPRGNEFFELLYGPNHPGSYNRVGYHNQEFDKYFLKASLAKNNEEEARYVSKMNKIATRDVPILPLVHTKNFFVRQAWLKNYVPSDQAGGLEQYYDINQPLKKKLLNSF